MSWRELCQQFGVLFEKGVDHFDHLTSDTTYDFEFPTIGSLSFIVTALLGDQSLIQSGPLTVKLNSMGHTERASVSWVWFPQEFIGRDRASFPRTGSPEPSRNRI